MRVDEEDKENAMANIGPKRKIDQSSGKRLIDLDSGTKLTLPDVLMLDLKGHTTNFFYYTPGKLFGSRIRN